MDLHSLANRIYKVAIYIDAGRKSIAIRGKEQEGRISYEDGIAEAMTAFKEAQISADPQIIILAEYAFLSQELQFCEETGPTKIL